MFKVFTDEEMMGKHSDCLERIVKVQMELRNQLACVAETFEGSREQSMAMTKMDEARMWAEAAWSLVRVGEEPSHE